MIISECYGGGHRWYCTNCDVRQEHLTMITWTNSTPPKHCSRCTFEPAPTGVALKAHLSLKHLYGDKYVVPGSCKLLADLIELHDLSGGYNSGRIAAMINQKATQVQGNDV